MELSLVWSPNLFDNIHSNNIQKAPTDEVFNAINSLQDQQAKKTLISLTIARPNVQALLNTIVATDLAFFFISTKESCIYTLSKCQGMNFDAM
jgi:hypothetical protein